MKKENNNKREEKKKKEEKEKEEKEKKEEEEEEEEEAKPDETHEENPFDLEKLRLSQDFTDLVGVKKKLITVPVRRPHRQWFVRVRPEESFRLETAALVLEEDGETYLVDQSLWSELSEEIKPVVLFQAINRQAVVFLWRVGLPGPDGQHIESEEQFEKATLAPLNPGDSWQSKDGRRWHVAANPAIAVDWNIGETGALMWVIPVQPA